MSGDIDDIDGLEDELTEEDTELDLESSSVEFEEKEDDVPVKDTKHEDCTPPPATHENKMVHQLDDVTKESEEKASEIFDIIEGISNDIMEKEEKLN